ncbi:MAG: DUF6160 family protein [Pseudomonadota bacterium]
MTFKKLALASAIALVPVSGFSLEALDDSSLGDVTGQDGIEIDISTASPITADFYIHDTTGLGSTAAPTGTHTFDGAIVIDNFSFNGTVNIDIDAGDNANAAPSAPVLQINVSVPTATIITGDLRVANSQRDDATSNWGVNTISGVLLNTMTIAMSGLTLNIQLGNEPQGNMILVNSTITGGLSINSFALNDANSGGAAIGASNILVRDTAGGADLSLNVGVDASTAGLVIDVNNIGTLAGGMDLRITDLYLGTTGAGIVGDVTVVGLNLAGSTVTISGK